MDVWVSTSKLSVSPPERDRDGWDRKPVSGGRLEQPAGELERDRVWVNETGGALMAQATTATLSALQGTVALQRTEDLLDHEEVRALRNGESWAWERAYLLYARRLTGYLVVLLSSRDEAADALSETFLRALKGCHGLRGGPEQVPGWLFRIAHNVALDRRRAPRRRDSPSDQEDLPDVAAGPEGTAILRDEVAQVRAALAELDPQDRDVLVLRVCGRLSSAEVGRILGKRPGAVRMRQHRALQTLAVRLGGSV